MTLKTKLYGLLVATHASLFALTLFLYDELGPYLVAVEAILLLSLFALYRLINKALQPLSYIETFSSLLNEEDFNTRFSHLRQPDLDRLIDQFNAMLQRLHTERQAIGEQRGVFEKLMAESPIGVVLLDFDGRIADLNPAAEQLMSVQKPLVAGQTLAKLQESPLSECQLRHLSTVADNQHALIMAEQGRRLKVGHYTIRDRGFDRSFYLIYEMTSDIIESQKAAYEKLIRLMSHEVNNTIAITNSLLQSSLTYKQQMAADAQDDFEQALSIVINRCGSLNQFMQAYADVVKLAAPVKNPFNLTKLLRDLATLFYARCEELGIELKLDCDSDITILADANLMEQALINVLKNAIEAIGRKGSIQLQLHAQPNAIQLIIKDTGTGLSQEVQSQLFTPFFTSKETGQGVGLMLIREIFNLHNFSYSLSNNPDGIGACFALSIPVSAKSSHKNSTQVAGTNS